MEATVCIHARTRADPRGQQRGVRSRFGEDRPGITGKNPGRFQ